MFLGFVQCTYFWAPLDQEFLHVCEASIMFDLSRFSACQDGYDGRIPSRGVAVLERSDGGCGLPFGGGVAGVPVFLPRFEVEGDAPTCPFLWLSAGWGHVGRGFL